MQQFVKYSKINQGELKDVALKKYRLTTYSCYFNYGFHTIGHVKKTIYFHKYLRSCRYQMVLCLRPFNSKWQSQLKYSNLSDALRCLNLLMFMLILLFSVSRTFYEQSKFVLTYWVNIISIHFTAKYKHKIFSMCSQNFFNKSRKIALLVLL